MSRLPAILAGVSWLMLIGCAPAPEATMPPARPECIAPAKPGGGFDLTCRIVSDSLRVSGLLETPVRVTFKPGGIGAVAMAHMLTTRRSDPSAIVAFSTGSVLNIAQGKFGRGLDFEGVRWLAAAGVDYGAIIVRHGARWRTLGELVDTLRSDPRSVVFGAGGTVGSQDWMKAALLQKALGVDPEQMRYVAFEGGGDALAALLGGHIDVMPGDVAEVIGMLGTDTVTVLAVLAEERLVGAFAQIPTAVEQGVDVVWPIFRGYYLAPDVTEAQYDWWVSLFTRLMRTEAFKASRAAKGLLPLELVGAEFADYVTNQSVRYEALAREFRLVR